MRALHWWTFAALASVVACGSSSSTSPSGNAADASPGGTNNGPDAKVSGYGSGLDGSTGTPGGDDTSDASSGDDGSIPTDGSSISDGGAAITAPPAAVQVGYTRNVFDDELDDLHTVDVNNTQVAGYNWYVADPFDSNQQVGSSAVACAANYSIAPAIVTVGSSTVLRVDGTTASVSDPCRGTNGHTTRNGSQLVGTITGVHGTVGQSFGLKNGHGFYLEARVAMASPTNPNNGWPSFWAYSAHHFDNNIAAQHWPGVADTSYLHFFEFDVMEFNPAFWPSASDPNAVYAGTIHDWYGDYEQTCSGGYCNVQSTNNVLNKPDGSAEMTSTEAAPIFHTFAALWVPSVASGSTYSKGYAQYFFDDQPMGTVGDGGVCTGGDCNNFTGVPPSNGNDVPAYGLPWLYSILQSDPQALVLATGGGAFLFADWVRVWQ